MGRLNGRPLGAVDRARLRAARLQAHHAAQWLARAARAYVPPKPDDGHTNLGWDGVLDGFWTHPLEGGQRLGLKIADLALVWSGESLAFNDRADKDALKWLGKKLAAAGFDPGKLDAPAPYEIPAHPVAQGAAYNASDQAASGELAAWFATADRFLGAIRDTMAAGEFAASPVRCWPHHFDIATLATLDQTRSVNAGLSPGDEHYDEPYFYVSPYPYPAAASLPALPPPGHWHTQGFTAAVAPASRIFKLADPMAEIETFLRAALRAAATSAIEALG
jgi:Family of unknown function (DUF5996)